MLSNGERARSGVRSLRSQVFIMLPEMGVWASTGIESSNWNWGTGFREAATSPTVAPHDLDSQRGKRAGSRKVQRPTGTLRNRGNPFLLECFLRRCMFGLGKANES